MKEWAKSFYLSAAWENTRAAYLISQDFICERCGEPAKIVHHKRCLAMVAAGELDAADLERKIESLEKQRYIQCAVVETAPEKKAVTIYYCAEAAEGMVFDADGVTGTVTAVTHIQSEKAREMEENGNDRTVLTLSKGVEAAGGVIALETAAMVAGMTADDIKALKGVLKQYE